MTEPPGDRVRPTAFVSYAQGSDAWQKTVLQFTTALRSIGGIEAELDLFHGSDHRQWTTFGPNLIDKSDFTLVAVDAHINAAGKARRQRESGPAPPASISYQDDLRGQPD